MTTSLLHSRLRSLALQRGLYRIGIEADTDNFPCRLLWRDSFSGESGTLCKFYPPQLLNTVSAALLITADLRANPPRKAPKPDLPVELNRRVRPKKEAKKPDEVMLQCANCPQAFPARGRNRKHRNFCSEECRDACYDRERKGAKVSMDAELDRRAEEIWKRKAVAA